MPLSERCALPWVASAQVRRKPPATVVLDVVARKPIGILGQHLGGVAGGHDRRRHRTGPGAERLPHIKLTTDAVPVPGQSIADEAAHNALALHQALPGRASAGPCWPWRPVGARTVRVKLALASAQRSYKG